MPNSQHIKILRQGVSAWNEWRKNTPHERPALNGANLVGMHLSGIDLSYSKLNCVHFSDVDLSRASLRGADLNGADLCRACFVETDLSEANLDRAKLVDANLSHAELSKTELSGANMTRAQLSHAHLVGARIVRASLKDADLSDANISNADLRGADLSGATVTGLILHDTILANTNLSCTAGLDECHHLGPSILDHRTIQQSNGLPMSFMQGCGLPDNLIKLIPHITKNTQFFSAFISHSSNDEDFARKLFNDLQEKGVRCWFAPEHLRTGDRIRDRIEQEIGLHDKLIVILSAESVGSNWVSSEVEAAMDREGREKKEILFPVCIDDHNIEMGCSWANEIHRTLQVADFTKWNEPDQYQIALSKLVCDLTSLD